MAYDISDIDHYLSLKFDGSKIPQEEFYILKQAVDCFHQGYFFASNGVLWMFIEMALRSRLVIQKVIDLGEDLNPSDKLKKLEEVEAQIENQPKENAKFDDIIQKVIVSDLFSKEDTETIQNRLKDIWSFNNICNELLKLEKLSKEDISSLKKYYSKYRNTILHGKHSDLGQKTTEVKEIKTPMITLNGDKVEVIKTELSTNNTIIRKHNLEEMYEKAFNETLDVVGMILNKLYTN